MRKNDAGYDRNNICLTGMEDEGIKMKPYVKPELFYENFELSQHIAACAWDMSNSTSVENCSAASDPEWGLPGGITAFYADRSICINGPVESYCYTNGSSGNNIFNS